MSKRTGFIGLATIVILGLTWLWNSGTLPGDATSPNAILEKSLTEGKPVVVFFYSHDCPQCELMKEPIRQAQEEFSGSVPILEVDVNDLRNQIIVRKAGVFAVPTMVFYNKDGKKQLHLGVMKTEDLRDRLLALKTDFSTSK